MTEQVAKDAIPGEFNQVYKHPYTLELHNNTATARFRHSTYSEQLSGHGGRWQVAWRTSPVVQALGPASVRLARWAPSVRRLARIMREMSTVSRYAVRVSSLVPHTGFSSKIGTCRLPSSGQQDRSTHDLAEVVKYETDKGHGVSGIPTHMRNKTQQIYSKFFSPLRVHRLLSRGTCMDVDRCKLLCNSAPMWCRVHVDPTPECESKRLRGLSNILQLGRHTA